jgi:PAS domain S-box-containing protein
VSQHVEARAERASATAGDTGWPAVIVTDPDGAVVQWSASATGMYGWTPEEAIGRTTRDLIVGEAERADAAAVFARLAAGEPWEGRFRVRHRDGTTFVAHVHDIPLRDAAGQLLAIVGMSYPVGEARFPLLAAERAMRASAARATERLRRLQELTVELSRVMTTDEVAATVLARGMHLEGAGSGAMWLVDEATGLLRLIGTSGTAPGIDARFAAIPLDLELPGPLAVRNKEAYYLRSRADRDERWPSLTGVVTAMEAQAVLPFVVDDVAIGCVSFGFPDEREFGQGERDFLTALTNVCAQVLDRARLYDAERAASRRVAFLAEASRLLNGSLDYQVTLERVVSLLLEAFAAAVMVDLVSPDGIVEHVALGHVDPAKRDLLEGLRQSRVRPGTNAWDVVETGTARLVPEVTDEFVRSVTTPSEYAAISAVAPGPSMIVPLTAGGRVTGLL